MKKAFSLMEIIISIVILSFVMISLIQIKMNNIFLVSKVNENSSLEEYALLSIDFNDNILDKNESIFLSDKYNFQNDDIKISLKEIEINIKDEKKESKNISSEFNVNIKSDLFYRKFEFKNSNLNKKIYQMNLYF
ncbi:hypothetical protein NG755_10985 [Aliarcobacter cryaerophilus]|uniref:Uncharacterized protein n=2 Tax=Aliarcobacter cryaerophilus TaxID=28198 RepID=A0AAD0TWZ3_9BACT|nr:hypothetical protein [Aliarcobacter cryaerophilus]AYJ81199.1 hypothetical protein ACRYA_a0074 [Aliarcobacter cryaerophilus ATCC 43158]QCZ24861.1 hypothetical protein AN286_10360 [Aliarcobacter cryaerophilus ATCC 43158]